ncbi:MAG: AAC(3) family N-acetyltransferase [Flavobacteriales bacterium]|nr:AAC(3) family N-acetyltransferase [Flavobacteriales bacterium]
MGVRAGDTVQLMADVTRMAWHARRTGQPPPSEGLLDAFVAAVGPSGNVLVPTYNFDLRSGDRFDPRHTRSISGALAGMALRHPAFSRTAHPLHSFAVSGADADTLLRSQEQGSFGPGSPFAFLFERRAALIAIDLPLNDALTFVHFVEERIGVPYRAHTYITLDYTDRSGATTKRRFSAYAKKHGHQMDFTALEPILERTGALTRGTVAGSQYLRVDLAAAYGVIADEITLNGARNIHRFSWNRWLNEHVKDVLRTFGYRTRQERTAHAARTA